MDWLLLAIIGTALLAGYLLPSIVAVGRKAPNAASVVVINVLLGWTLVGWAASLAMACKSHPAATVVQVQQVVPNRPQDQRPPWQ